MELNCEQIVESYLLNKNPLYAFRFPLSILISIIVFGISKAYKWSENSYINQILIPILSFLLSMVLLDIISRFMISHNETVELLQLCKLWMYDSPIPSVENFGIQDNNYSFNMEDNKEELKNKILEERKKIYIENVENPISKISNMSPYPLEYNKEKGMCIEKSGSCNLCSGSNSNPSNLIAPIPGPQWLPQTAETVQNRLKNNEYTEGRCSPF